MSDFCLCLGNVWLPGLLPIVICDARIVIASSSSFSRVPLKVMLPAFSFENRVNKVADDLSLLTARHHFWA